MPIRRLFSRAAAALFAAASVTLALAGAAHAGTRLDRIMDTKVIRVGTPGDYRPFAIKTDAGYAGHDVELAEKLARELGARIEWVPTTWPNLMKDLQADRFDLAVGGITRNVNRIRSVAMLPGYAPFGKVALVRTADRARFTTLAALNRPDVRVVKNPGGTNETFVLENLKAAQISTHDKNAEIPALIADGKGDVMITETYEALYYARADARLSAVFVDAPLTPTNRLGFMLPADDADYLRTMTFVWELLDSRGAVRQAADTWLK